MQIIIHSLPAHFEVVEDWFCSILRDYGLELNPPGRMNLGLTNSFDFAGRGMHGYLMRVVTASQSYQQVSIEIDELLESGDAEYQRLCDALLSSAWRQDFGKYEVCP